MFKRIKTRTDTSTGIDELVVSLYPDEADSFLVKAMDKAKKYNILNDGDSPYGFNHPHSHWVGMLAEHATWELFNWLEETLNINLNIDPVCKDDTRDGECDIIVAGKRIEVKGIKYGAWLKYGPCISTRQLVNIKNKADIVLWVLFNEKRLEFTFKGFNVVSDIETIKPEYTGTDGMKVLNYPVKSIIKPFSELTF